MSVSVMLARLRGSNERGAALVEFALAVPLLLVVLFGVVDFGIALSNMADVRHGVQTGARQGTTASLGTNSTCPLTPAPANTNTRLLMCRVKDLTPISEKADLRVGIFLPTTYTVGESMRICLEYPQDSASGFFDTVLATVNLRSTATMRIERVLASGTIAAAQETSQSGSWAWCA